MSELILSGIRRWAFVHVLVLTFAVLPGMSTIVHAADALPKEEAPELGVSGAQSAAKDAESRGLLKNLWEGLTDEAHLKAGYGIVQWRMVLKRSSDDATATMVQRDNSALFLSYGSKPSFFKDSHFGYTFMVSYVDFDMKNQDVTSDHFADFGTEVHGYLFYVVPTLYYQWGEHRYKGNFIRLGFGIGAGAASYSGTARLSTGEVVHVDQRTYEPRLALSNFLEARWRHIGLSFSYAAPRVYGDGYDIRVNGFSVNIGYAYYF